MPVLTSSIDSLVCAFVCVCLCLRTCYVFDLQCSRVHQTAKVWYCEHNRIGPSTHAPLTACDVKNAIDRLAQVVKAEKKWSTWFVVCCGAGGTYQWSIPFVHATHKSTHDTRFLRGVDGEAASMLTFFTAQTTCRTSLGNFGG